MPSSERRSPFRRAAEAAIAAVLANAAARQLTSKGLRAALRKSFAALVDALGSRVPKTPRGVWYAAIKSVTGVGILDLPDPSQVALLRAERTRRRRSRKDDHAR